MKTSAFGIEFRSRAEAKLAKILNDKGLEWVYEPVSILLPNGEFYLPDFFLPKQNTVIEYRGYTDAKGERQISGFADMVERGLIGNVNCKLVTLEPKKLDELPMGCTICEDELGEEASPMLCGDGSLRYIVIKPDKIGFSESRNLQFGSPGCIDYNTEVWLVTCGVCKQKFFASLSWSYQCGVCGAWDGDHHIEDTETLTPDEREVLMFDY